MMIQRVLFKASSLQIRPTDSSLLQKKLKVAAEIELTCIRVGTAVRTTAAFASSRPSRQAVCIAMFRAGAVLNRTVGSSVLSANARFSPLVGESSGAISKLAIFPSGWREFRSYFKAPWSVRKFDHKDNA